MERRSIERQTMALNQFSRRQFKRRDRTGRLTTKRPFSFENLLLSGKKPVPSATSSLYKNISTTLKENVNPESRISQNVDDFWAVERQKRISAVARRKLTGGKETTQEVDEQPVECRKARHARSRRVGGSRTVGAKPEKLDVYIDAELIADWDKENLEVEEEKPCTIASSEAFMSAQETALRASVKVQNTMDHRVEAVSGTCSPTHSQVNACKVDGEPKAQTPRHYDQATDAKSSSSLEDMDLSSGESTGCLMQNITNPHECTPDLASLVEMDWNTSCPPRSSLENALNSQDTLRYQVQDAAGPTVDTKRKIFSPRLVEQEGRVNEDQGCIRSLLMHCSLDRDVSCTNRDGTPFHDAQSQRTRLPTTSPTPPSKPFAVYMSTRQPLNETGELSQRKLSFGNCSPSSSLDFGEDCQNAEIPDLEVDWDRISYNDDPQYVDVPDRDHEVAMTHRLQNTSRSCASQQCPPDDTKAETQTCVDLQSQPDDITADTQPCTNPDSQADNVTAEEFQPEPRQQSQAKKPRRRKVQHRRCSLEGSENGSTWEGGQRRSQRIRVRPLEWWRGEKLLYGRIHDSLTTVIGIKQSSPGKYSRGIKVPFVIESFVPEEYDELVRFMAI